MELHVFHEHSAKPLKAKVMVEKKAGQTLGRSIHLHNALIFYLYNAKFKTQTAGSGT